MHNLQSKNNALIKFIEVNVPINRLEIVALFIMSHGFEFLNHWNLQYGQIKWGGWPQFFICVDDVYWVGHITVAVTITVLI